MIRTGWNVARNILLVLLLAIVIADRLTERRFQNARDDGWRYHLRAEEARSAQLLAELQGDERTCYFVPEVIGGGVFDQPIVQISSRLACTANNQPFDLYTYTYEGQKRTNSCAPVHAIVSNLEGGHRFECDGTGPKSAFIVWKNR